MRLINPATTSVRFLSPRGYTYDVQVKAILNHVIQDFVEKGHYSAVEAPEIVKKAHDRDPAVWIRWVGDILEWKDVHAIGELVSKEPVDAFLDIDPIDCMISLDPIKPQKYILGNHLRGCFEGDFSSMDQAWKVLSARFLLSFPSTKGLRVLMWVKEKNHYGFESNMLCKTGVTSLEPVEEALVAQCQKSFHIG